MTVGTELDNLRALAFPTTDSVEVVVSELITPDLQLESLLSCLSADERLRQQRFLLPDIRRRFGICRARLRHAIGNMLGISAGDVKFKYNRLGKPSLADLHKSPLQFNVSHSDDWALFAFSKSTPVGIDIEVPRVRTKFLELASQVLSEKELAAIESMTLAERELQIKLAWVAKESLLKAIGVGIGTGMRLVELRYPLQLVSTPLSIDALLLERIDDDGTCRSSSWIDARAWRVHQLDIQPNATAALTCFSRIANVNLLRI